MNILITIAICLFASSVLQMIGMAIYSEIYKKKFLSKELGEGEPGQNALFLACEHADKLPAGPAAYKKAKSYKNIFEFRVTDRVGNVRKEISPVISMKQRRKNINRASL